MDAKQTLDFYTPEQRMGLICQRGGQELALNKSIDRFTVCFDDSSTSIGMVLPIKEQKSILGSSLQELQVNPIHLAPAMQEIRQQSNVKFVSHVYFFEASPHSPVYLTNEIMVQYRSEEEERQGWENDHGLELIKPIMEIPHTYIYRVGESATQNPLKIVNQLKAHEGILRAEVNIIAERRTFALGGDALSIEDWYHNALPGAGEEDQAHIHLRDAWQMTKGDSKVALAIADLSFSYQGATNLLGEVAVGSLTGVAPECELVPLPSPQYFDDGAIEEFFDLATAREASVILCNWLSTSIYLPLSLRQTLAIHRAATKGRQGKGCVVIVPAGNANRPLDGIIFERNWGKELPEGATQWLSGLALHPDVITVAACTSYNQKAAYSNWGSMVSVCAPSDSAIPCIWRNQQQLIPTTPQLENLSGARVLKKEFEDNGHGFGGTEFAAALVAGIAALTIAANPNLTAKQVREVLETTADKIIDPNPDRQLGLEMGSYEDNGHSEWFGYGRVNAKQAVERAINFE